METTDLDDLLRDFNITVNNGSTQNQQQETVEESSPVESFFSEEDILDIITENETSEEEEEVQPSEESSEQNTVAEETETDDSTEESQQSEKPDTIPCNSPTLLINETTTRFSGAEWFNEIQKARVIVAGIGGIGSNFCFHRQCSRIHGLRIISVVHSVILRQTGTNSKIISHPRLRCNRFTRSIRRICHHILFKIFIR